MKRSVSYFILFLVIIIVGTVSFYLFLQTGEESEITSWAYQLQNANPVEIANSNFDLVVIDYSWDGTEDLKYTPQEIQLMQESGKILIAYISIGEAEDYRFYWNASWDIDPPDWIGKENPE
ncbi:MAG: endo alpha-1,4 polygalactosaminidase [Candidatus Njordarchaeales archaeon]